MDITAFLSYCHEDTGSASRIYRDLAARGIRCWLDKEDLLPGQRWRETVESAIRESSHFVALLSEHSVTKEGFVQRELKLALDYLTEMPPNRIFLIPVRLDACVPAHPALRDLHWVDLFPDYPTSLERIARAIVGRGENDVIGDSSTHRRDTPPATLPPLDADRPRQIYLQFPMEKLYAELRGARERVRLLFTWVYSPDALVEALSPTLRRGVRIEILMLDPKSQFTSLRSEEIGFGDPRHGTAKAEAGLEALTSWLQREAGLETRVEIRLYDRPPTVVMIDTGERLVYMPLFAGALAVEGPCIEARQADQELYLRVQRHFERLWEQAEVFRIED